MIIIFWFIFFRPALSSWKSILDTTEKVANAHVACSDKYKNEVYENLKDCKVNKEGTLKKVSYLSNLISTCKYFVQFSRKMF